MVPSQHSALRGALEWIVVIAIALAATFLIRKMCIRDSKGIKHRVSVRPLANA